MKTFILTTINTKRATSVMTVIACLLFSLMNTVNAQLCSSPSGSFFGLTGTGEIRSIDVASGAVGVKLNPANTGMLPDLSNAMGYNPVNGKIYYFKRNIINAPQQFVVFDPILNTVTVLANSPVTSIINLGCISADGLGYYCIDAFGRLYYYNIGTNIWNTVSTNVRDQFNVQLQKIITPSMGTPTTSSRIYGDIAFDGSGNMWVVISGPSDYGIYKIPAPLPKTAMPTPGLLTMYQVLAPTTPSPGLKSIGGAAFNSSGQLLISTNAGDNKLYRLENNYSLTYLSTMTLDGVGTDLSSCSFPMYVLAETFKSFKASSTSDHQVSVNWSFTEPVNTKGYEVQYSRDGNNWQTVSYLDATGRNEQENYYHYAHTTLVESKQYYRIAKVCLDGYKTYSATQQVTGYGYAKMNIWPDMSHHQLNVEVSGLQGNNGSVLIFDNNGRQLSRASLHQGINQLDISALHRGLYHVQVLSSNGNVLNNRFIKQ